MIEIGRAIVSRDILEECFQCDLSLCKGACCVEGDSGAPLTPEEARFLESGYPLFQEFLSPLHRQTIESAGYSMTDSDGDLVTPLVKNRQCVYSYVNPEGILKCAVEKAWTEGKISFRKPVSCHLFPIRITSYAHFDAVNYQKIEICRPGRECGKNSRLPLYRFLRDPLVRKYGETWMAQLEWIAKRLVKTAEKPTRW